MVKLCENCHQPFSSHGNMRYCNISCAFWSHVRMDGDHWIWVSDSDDSEPRFTWKDHGRQYSVLARVYATRVITSNSRIKTVTRQCKNPACINPAHMTIVYA